MNREAVSPVKISRASNTLGWFCFGSKQAGTERADVTCVFHINFFGNNFSDCFIKGIYIKMLVLGNASKSFLHKSVQEPNRSCVAIRHHGGTL